MKHRLVICLEYDTEAKAMIAELRLHRKGLVKLKEATHYETRIVKMRETRNGAALRK